MRAQRRTRRARKVVTDTFRMKTILVPIDFSRFTQHVVAHAVALARESGVRMTLLNVTRPASLLADHAKLLELAEKFAP